MSSTWIWHEPSLIEETLFGPVVEVAAHKGTVNIRLVFQRTPSDGWVCRSVDLSMQEDIEAPDVDISPSFLREINLGLLMRNARKRAIEATEMDANIANVRKYLRPSGWDSWHSNPLPDFAYACVAYAYQAFCEAGSRNVIQDLARVMQCEINTAKYRVKEARRRELLTSPQRNAGRNAYSAITEQGLEVLRERIEI